MSKREASPEEVTIVNKRPKEELVIEKISNPDFLAKYRIKNMDGGDFQYKEDLFAKDEADKLYEQVLELEREYGPYLLRIKFNNHRLQTYTQDLWQRRHSIETGGCICDREGARTNEIQQSRCKG